MSAIVCPICKIPMTSARAEWPQFPFCSPRCRTIDLGRWLGERYAVDDGSSDAESDESSPDGPES